MGLQSDTTEQLTHMHTHQPLKYHDEYFTALKIFHALPIYPFHPPPATTDLFTFYIVLHFPQCHIMESPTI